MQYRWNCTLDRERSINGRSEWLAKDGSYSVQVWNDNGTVYSVVTFGKPSLKQMMQCEEQAVVNGWA